MVNITVDNLLRITQNSRPLPLFCHTQNYGRLKKDSSSAWGIISLNVLDMLWMLDAPRPKLICAVNNAPAPFKPSNDEEAPKNLSEMQSQETVVLQDEDE